nr:OmpA family protein [uncultured Flavobacterium sp.]
MKKSVIFAFLVSALFLGNTNSNAQTGLKRAQSNYEKLAYFDAIQIYEKVVKRGFTDAQLLQNIGNSYYFNGDYQQANAWYQRLFNEFSQNDIPTEYYYRFAQTLQSSGEHDKANSYFKEFAKQNQNSTLVQFIKSEKELKKEIEKNSGRYTIQDAKINSPYSDYGTSFYNNQVLFATARDTGNFSKRVFTWTGDAFTKVYAADIQQDGTLAAPKLLSKKITSKFNESTPIITKDGKTMYFTRNNYLKKERGFDEEKTTLLKIYKAEKINEKWTNVTELPFNSNQFSTAHPVLNDSEDTMYFVSDRPGGFGSSDIWKVAIHEKSFGKPVNLGPKINTSGRETFPFITPNNELYFATDARQGLGGLDVYVTKFKLDGSFTEPQNIGAPVNSEADDFAYAILPNAKTGFFSSNRNGGVGKDDLYAFVQNKELTLDCLQKLFVKVVDAKSNEIINNADLNLFELDFSSKAHTKNLNADQKYHFDMPFDCESNYRLRVAAENYLVSEKVVTLNNENGITEVTVALNPKKIEVKPQDDLFKVFDLNPIYFDLDKDNIRPDAAIELAKIVEVLNEYPDMKIDVRSHTDSRGSDSYNLKLSQRRAKSTANWIIAQGIAANRITYKGFGETQLINDCKNGVKCSDAEHEENRRSEFIVQEL